MDLKPKTEPDFASGDKNPMSMMSIPDLISILRTAIYKKQYDQVESALVAREALLEREVGKMREILDFDRLDRMKIEEDLKRCEEKCEKAKKSEELYEKLLESVKKNGLRDEEEDATIDELRRKNRRLEDELKLWKRKFLDLNGRVSRLEFDTELLMKVANSEKEDFEAKVKKEHNVDSNCSKASASEKLGSLTIIKIHDSDDDEHPVSSEATQQKNISNRESKRKFGSRGYPLQSHKRRLIGLDTDFTPITFSDSDS